MCESRGSRTFVETWESGETRRCHLPSIRQLDKVAPSPFVVTSSLAAVVCRLRVCFQVAWRSHQRSRRIFCAQRK